MKNILFAASLATVILFCACSSDKSPAIEYKMYGVSFTCPADWKVTDSTDYGDMQLIFVEKEGFSASGLLTISIGNVADVEPEDLNDIMQESLQEQEVFHKLVFSETSAGNYAGQDGLFYSYTTQVLGIPHEGRVYIFVVGEKVIAINEQESVDDKKKNAPGFESIRSSFCVDTCSRM